MNAPPSNSRRLISPGLENPVRGCLLIDTHAPNSHPFFVFRRRELMNLPKPAFQSQTIRVAEAAEPAPPKNKTEDHKRDGYFYRQATPNGVLPPERRAVEAMLNLPPVARERHE